MNKTAAFACLLSLAATTARAEPPPGFTRLADVAPDIAQDMRYAGSDNFTGHPVPGYRAPQCWLRAEAATALAAAQKEAKAQGFSLVVYDCYRPMRAVASFVDWSRNADQGTKPAYYPNLDKSQLFAQGYIAAQSTHSTGLAVDLGVVGWDFGTPFDFFDPRSWTKSKVAGDARAHRDALVALMKRHGFENYPREWWHYAFKGAGDVRAHDEEVK
ncbi:M15 family metallopeptidase [Methylocystis iwaonis]|uniref:D-alanyl-D-alanine dipeptidase n=1 Tax=Methylocystis iwaonis TaxID=2885079 RepID=A0ABM8E8U1_9HYPH|nr:M15 family metallopeptidase [Methylocystis iwaonis]BDV34389.1 D-alanyl-D-alanine dipeptidase [Methylocystis iwaonis]